MKTKQLLLTCLLVIVGSMAGQKAFAYDAKIGSIYYNFSGSEATVTYQKYDGSNYSSDYSGAIVIPKTVTYNGKTYRVTSIGDYAFYYCNDLTYITIPNSVTSIGIKAFSDCYALSSVSLPETVRTIGEAAFWSCINMRKVNIPKYITEIEPNCFYHCMALTSVTIPKGVTSIGYQAFQHCNNLATLICLPPTAPAFGDNVIAYTAARGVDIYVPAEGMTSYQNIGFKSDRRLHPMEVGSVLPSNKWSDAEYTVQTISYDSGVIYGNGNESNPHYNKIVGVPDADANGKNWYDIDYLYQWEEQTAPLNSWCQSGNYGDIYVRRAFYYDNDDIPEELYLACGHDDAPCEYYLNGELLFSETDGWNEFCTHKLTEAQKVLLKPGQLNILAFHVHQNWGGMYADSGIYSSLEEMGISNECGDNLFWTFDEETKTLTITGKGDMYDFENTNSVPWSFYYGEIKHICIQPGATSIGSRAFAYPNWNITDIVIPEGITRIGRNAFSDCYALSSVSLPETVRTIGEAAFWSCINMTEVNIPKLVTKIEPNCFYNCNALKSISIPSNVTSIGNGAFQYCNNLTDVWCYAGAVPSTGSNLFYGSPITSDTLHVPAGSLNAYRTTAPWSGFGTIVAINNIDFADANVKAICVANWDTSGDGELSEEEAAAVTDLGEVFISNTEITSFNELQFFTGLTSIGESAFYECSGLTSVTIPNSVTGIGNNAFYECTSLTSVTIGNSVTSIGESAFYECTSLTSITIPKGVTSIGYEAFYGAKLRNILIKCVTPPDALEDQDPAGRVDGTFSRQSIRHATLYVPSGCWETYAFDEIWFVFNNIRETATEEEQLSMQQAYTLMDASTFAYSVYDPVNDRISSVNVINEDNPNHCWQVIDVDGERYLYNIGAKKFVTTAGDYMRLSGNATSIEMQNGNDGIVLGEQKGRQWAFVNNDNMNVEDAIADMIKGITPTFTEDDAAVYNLAGQRLSKPQKGINIKNGKKYLVK